MPTVAIKELEMHLSNSRLPMGQSAICFEISVQKKGTGKQTAGTLYYKYQEFVL